jgi:hypothetical protein
LSSPDVDHTADSIYSSLIGFPRYIPIGNDSDDVISEAERITDPKLRDLLLAIRA